VVADSSLSFCTKPKKNCQLVYDHQTTRRRPDSGARLGCRSITNRNSWVWALHFLTLAGRIAPFVQGEYSNTQNSERAFNLFTCTVYTHCVITHRPLIRDLPCSKRPHLCTASSCCSLILTSCYSKVLATAHTAEYWSFSCIRQVAPRFTSTNIWFLGLTDRLHPSCILLRIAFLQGSRSWPTHSTPAT